MESLKIKTRWAIGYFRKLLKELAQDLFSYYFSTYPILLILRCLRRMARRFKIIWLGKPKGRPPIHENVVDLIVEMKRENLGWGAQRISDELNLLGIKVSKKSVLKILRSCGFVPPKQDLLHPHGNLLLIRVADFGPWILPVFLIPKASSYLSLP